MGTVSLCFFLLVVTSSFAVHHDSESDEKGRSIPDILSHDPDHSLSSSFEEGDAHKTRAKRFLPYFYDVSESEEKTEASNGRYFATIDSADALNDNISHSFKSIRSFLGLPAAAKVRSRGMENEVTFYSEEETAAPVETEEVHQKPETEEEPEETNGEIDTTSNALIRMQLHLQKLQQALSTMSEVLDDKINEEPKQLEGNAEISDDFSVPFAWKKMEASTKISVNADSPPDMGYNLDANSVSIKKPEDFQTPTDEETLTRPTNFAWPGILYFPRQLSPRRQLTASPRAASDVSITIGDVKIQISRAPSSPVNPYPYYS